MLRTVGLMIIRGCTSALPLVCALLFVGCAHTSNMQTREYLVDDIFWEAMNGRSSSNFQEFDYSDCLSSRKLTEFLVFMDVSFPKGAFIILTRSENKVMLHNVPEQLDRIEELLGPMKGKGTFFRERLQ